MDFSTSSEAAPLQNNYLFRSLFGRDDDFWGWARENKNRQDFSALSS
jgi:hypothetical protein